MFRMKLHKQQIRQLAIISYKFNILIKNKFSNIIIINSCLTLLEN